MAEIPPKPERQQQVVMAGTPHTGKTTFLALFYLTLTNQKRTRLRLASWFGEREYLNEIADQLLSCTEANRTPLPDPRALDLPLETPAGEVVRLEIPDLSGELWQEALAHRRWPADIEERVEQADAKLVFVHSREIDSGPSINASYRAQQILDGFDGPAATSEDEKGPNLGADAPKPAANGDPGAQEAPGRGHGGLPGSPPTQVDLLDLIQLTCEQRGPRPTRLGLIISAWDRASGDPETFVSQNLPMLDQYLKANSSWLESRVFGVSAQGGRFDDPEHREALAALDPVDRAVIKTASGHDADVGDIVEWAIGLD